jgi:hypothetical protein
VDEMSEPIQIRLTGTPEAVNAMAERIPGFIPGTMTVKTRNARLVQGYITVVIDPVPAAELPTAQRQAGATHRIGGNSER